MGDFIVLDSTSLGIFRLTLNYEASQPADFLLHFDRLGVESGKAQLLTGPITSQDKLQNSDHVAITWTIQSIPIGFIKYGVKDLYMYTKQGKVVECRGTPCLLDFYVSEDQQRSGIGKNLFEKVLELFQLSPRQLAYDRPSPKLVAFLARHYQLVNGDLQPNRFMIFEGFGA